MAPAEWHLSEHFVGAVRNLCGAHVEQQPLMIVNTVPLDTALRKVAEKGEFGWSLRDESKVIRFLKGGSIRWKVEIVSLFPRLMAASYALLEESKIWALTDRIGWCRCFTQRSRWTAGRACDLKIQGRQAQGGISRENRSDEKPRHLDRIESLLIIRTPFGASLHLSRPCDRPPLLT